MDTDFWQHQLDAFLAAPMPSLIFLAVRAIAASWLSSTIWQARWAAAEERAHVAQERLNFAAEQTRQGKELAEQLRAELENFRAKTQNRMLVSPREVEDGATKALTYVARLIKRGHDLGETLDAIPIVGTGTNRGTESGKMQ